MQVKILLPRGMVKPITQPFKGAPHDVTVQVAAYLGNLAPGVISAIGYVSRREYFVLPTPPNRPKRKMNPTRRRRWAVRG